MLRILATDGMEKGAVAALADLGCEVVQEFYEPDVLKEKVREFDVLVVRSATKVREPILKSALDAGKLKLIIRGGVGVDNIDVRFARENGIAVCNTPDASSASVAELAIGHMFALARFIGMANVTMREGKWEKKAYKGTEIAGKTLGLVGMGRIARETARRAHALGMEVIYTNRSGAKAELAGYTWLPLEELLARADYVSLHMPAQKGAPALFDEALIGKMKDGAFLINTARGALVDEAALIAALDSGKLAGAGIDVYQEEPCRNEALYTHPKVSVTPHVGGSTKEAQKRIGAEIVAHIRREFRI